MQWVTGFLGALRALVASLPRRWRMAAGVGAATLASLALWTGASAAIAYVSASEAYDPDIADTLTVARPTGVVAGDVLLAAVTIRDTNTINLPAGWTQVITSQVNSLTNPNLRVFYKVAGGAEPSTYTFTTAGNESIAVGVVAFRGIDTANPIAASAVQANNTASTSGVAPGVTPGVANAMLVSVWATHDNGGDDPKVTVPASMTRVVGATMMPDNTAETRLTMAREALTAATFTGTRTAALSTSYRTNTATIALRPAGYTVSGTVFEDVHYGGGAGRDRATAVAAGGSGRPNARVELSTVSGTTATVVAVATTDASGNYSFTGLASGNYALRVVSSTVTSARTGYSAALLPVTTYRATGTSGSAVAVTNEVGGGAPAVTGYASTNANVGTTASTTLTYAEAVSFLTVGSANVGAMDFGFNFDTVTNLNDSGPGSLRQVISNANALGNDTALRQSGRTDFIEHVLFMISNGTAAAGLRSSVNYFSGGVATVSPTSALPAISSALVVNAQTQPGWGSAPVVVLAGTNAGASASGLSLQGHTGSTVRGFVVRNFTSHGINIANGGSHTIAGNYVGLNAAGTAAAANGAEGINVFQSGSNLIGGTSATDLNVISGNGNNGIVVTGTGATGNLIRGNYVGTNAAGAAAIRNESLGVYIGSSGNTVGGTTAGAGNLISGNRFTGLSLDTGATGTAVQGNTIGLNALGTAAVANGNQGLYVASAGSTIGGSVSGAGNVISGNANQGVNVAGASNTISGNTIGLNAAGTAAVPNSYGVYVNNVAGTVIGGTTALERNVISGNTLDGVGVTGASANSTVVRGNYIGTNPAGDTARGNGRNGVYVAAAGASTTVGTAVTGGGNLISGNGLNGVQIDTAGVTVQGNLIGTNAAGTGALGNAAQGVYVGAGNGQVIGGTSAAARNVISANVGGIFVNAGSGHTIQGNYIGTTADGAAALGNTGYFGVELYGSGSNQVGGTAAGAGNLISGQTGAGKGGIYLASNGNTLQGNKVGSNAAGTAGLPNAGPGIAVWVGSVVNNTIGGTATGAANLIAYNGAEGVSVIGAGSTGNLISRNAIHSNTGIGIDIAGGGRSANNGSKDNGLGNAEMDTPVISTASLSGSSLTVAGHVGSAAGQAGFAGATVDLFKALPDASGYGQGQTWLGTLTANASGNFSGTLSVSGLAGTDSITATATDAANNTSEFSLNKAVGQSIAGTVFEDVHYGGGAGRSLASSGGVGVSGATVELYRTSGSYVGSTTTAGNGAYSFTGLAAEGYVVRVLTSSVRSSRNVGAAGLWPVQTWRYESSTVPAAVTDEVGGAQPGVADSAAAVALSWTSCSAQGGTCSVTGTRLVRYGADVRWYARVLSGNVGCNNATFGDPANGVTGKTCEVLQPHLHSASSVHLVAGSASGVDFGFNFSTVVTTNDSGQGSLRQFITNANALGGQATLAQSGFRRTVANVAQALPSATETSIFMIPGGTAVGGLRSTTPNQLTGGVAPIVLTSTLPSISAANVSLDGSTQTSNVGDTNVGLVGTGGTVGADALTLSQVAKPEVELTFASLASGVAIAANNTTVRALALRATGTSTLNDGAISLSNDTTGALIEGNLVGSVAAALTVPATNQGLGVAVMSNGADNGTVRNNLIAYFQTTGVQLTGALSANWNISSNEFRDGGLDFDNTDAIALSSATGVTISGNRITGISTQAIVFGPGAGSGTQIVNNTIRGNGVGPSGSASIQSVSVVARSGASGVRIEANDISANYGAGVSVNSGASGIALTRNLIHGNGAITSRNGTAATGQIDIDLNSASDDVNLGAAPFVTLNDTGDADTGGNNLQNHPVLTSAVISGGTQLIVTGTLNSNANGYYRVEFFGNASPNTSGRGGGQTWLGFVNVATDGSGNAAFSTSLTATVAIGSYVTATAIRSDASYTTLGDTSEFAPNVQAGLSLTGTVFEDVNYGGGAGRSLAASGGVGVSGATVELYRASGAFVGSTTTGSGGTYSFTSLAAEGYVVRVLTSSVRSTRSGSTAGLWPVQTWRYESSRLTPTAVTDEVGGQQPGVADSAAALSLAWTSCSAQLSTCSVSGTRLVRYGIDTRWVTRVVTGSVSCNNTVFGDPAAGETGKTCEVLTQHLHSASSVHLASAGAAGVDFGFNFDTVVNTNDSGQGSLRQAIANANTLGGDENLRQSGRTDAIEHLVFMLGNGSNGAGLRSAYNAFTTPAGSTTAATIAIASQLPALTSPLVIDAQTQPGWTLQPRIELNGGGLGDTLLTMSAGNSVLRGFVINRMAGGTVLRLDTAGGNVVQGNWLGPDASGATATTSPRTFFQIEVFSGGNTIGGATPSARNVISNTRSNGIVMRSGNANVIQGNYIGTNAEGNAAMSNGDSGIVFAFAATSTNTVIGGVNAGEGNLISGNGAPVTATAGIAIQGAGNTGTVIRGNRLGLNAAGTATIASNGPGVYVAGPNTVVGGTAAGAGNTISGHAGDGVAVVGSGVTGVAILGNSLYGNAGQGIDLADDGRTANDGAKPTGQPNLLMDAPVFTAARARGAQLTVAGHVGTAAGQALFGGSRVEVFVSDSSSGFGSGRTYLGAVTADASGNFNGSFTMPLSALRAGSVLTGTATDTGNNTSEFGANFTGLVVDWLINHNGDSVDANPGDGLCETATAGQCTLRAAIQEANAWAGSETAAFALPGCPGAGCVITPASALPTVTGPLILDAQTQPGWTQAPVVELLGTVAGSTHGVRIAAAGSTVRGLSIGGFGQGGNYAGLYIEAANTTVEGNHVGLAADGSTARPNGIGDASSGGVHVASGSGTVIGGTTAAKRNVLSGNGGAGVWMSGGSATVIGNYIGTDATGSVAVGNRRWGVQVAGGSHQIGGAVAGQGNVVSGNVYTNTGGILLGSAGNTLQGNTIGLNAARTAALPNGNGVSTYAAGIDVRSSASAILIGGTNPGEGNVVAGNAGHGVRVASQTTRILGNSLYGNTWLGIDLNADGVTANDGAVSGSQPNNGMDHPVIGAAGYDPATRVLTVYGRVGIGTGQAVFAGARIELFKSDGDGSGYGEGSAFVGTLSVDGNGRYSGSVTVPADVVFAVGTSVTGTATDGAGNTSEFGPNVVTTTASAMAPSRFNAFETATPAGAVTGVIKTMTAGQATTLALIAIDASGSAVSTTFAGSVALEWLDARDNSGALDVNGCRSTWVSAGTAGTASFVSGAGRMNTGLNPSTVGREWRLRMSHTTGGGTTVAACSTDNFAVKPARLAVTALGSADSSTAGVGGAARSLVNANASGGVVHRAGRPFALRAQAQDVGSASTPGYDGTATIAITGCVLPSSGCTLGSLQHNGGAASLSAVSGLLASDTMTYSEVGAIAVRLTDASFADIDAADSTPAERVIESADVTIGRFVPDRYATALATAGVLDTVNAACTVAGAGYTFFGQAFGWATLPQFTVTAQNAQGATTTNWAGALQRLNPADHVAQSLAVSGVAGASLAQTHGSITLTDLGGGTARLAAQAPASFSLGRDPAAPAASGTPVFGWAASIADTSEAAVAGNGSISGTVAQAGIAFNQGGVFHTGRLALAPGHGDARTGVRLLVELQRYSAAGWVTMTEDRGCVTVNPTHITVSAPHGVFTTAGACAAPAQATVTSRGGRAWVTMPGTPARASGRLTAGLNLAAASSGTACQAAGVPVPAVPMNLPHLMGAWGGVATLTAEPRAALTWGKPNRDVVLTRERF